MPEYVLNRDYTLRSVNGVVSFKKDEPAWVVPALEKEAVHIGAKRVDGAEIELIPAEKVVQPSPAGGEREAQLYAAFDLIIEKNEAKEFTGQGVPTVKAVERLLGFDVDSSELVDAWHAYRQAKAEQ